MNDVINKMKAQGWAVARETASTVDFVRGEGENRVQVNIWLETETVWDGMAYEIIRFGASAIRGEWLNADDLADEIRQHLGGIR